MKYSAWHIIAFLFTLIGVLAIFFVIGIAFFFYRFNVNQVVEDKITDLELISNTIAGPSWTVKESYPGAIENTFRGVLKMPGVKFIRLIDSESNAIEKSGNMEEANNVNIDNLPLFGREVSVRDGMLNEELVKEFSVKARDGSDLWMGVSITDVKKNILFSAVLMGIVAMVLMTITIIVVFLLVRYIFMSPLAVLMSAFGKLKNNNYDVRLGKARIVEMQEVFNSFNQMVTKVKGAELKMAEELKRTKEIDRMKSEFISVAAHQLRTPLSAVKWTMKMLIDGDIGHLTHEQRTFLMQGYISNERIINLVNDLLNVARIEEGRFGYKFAMIQIEDLIESVVLDIKHRVKEKDLDFKFERSGLPKPPKVKIDPSRMRLVIQNLLDNAVKYTPKKGKVTISVKYSKLGIEVAVVDSGMGIPKEQQKQLFTKFFRGNNAVKSQTEGTGLGLFIVKNIVEKHYGKIWAESEENKGTAFRFTIPFQSDTE